MRDPKSKKEFPAKYYGPVGGKEAALSTGAEADAIIAAVKEGRIHCDKCKARGSQQNPPPPFTTSTMQQDASRKIGFSALKTMQTAQTLYEGVNLGGKLGTVGLITYMRTDSLRIAAEAQQEALEFIQAEYGAGVCAQAPV